MTAVPDDADSCVRHQCERGEDGELRGSFFLCPEQGDGADFGIAALLPRRTHVWYNSGRRRRGREANQGLGRADHTG